ncbi:MAG: DUF1127 domain-containing protein [Pseudomonadota bacterium]
MVLTAMNRLSLSEIVKGWIAEYNNWVSYTRTVEELRAHTEHELEDIGLTRGDIPEAAARAVYNR